MTTEAHGSKRERFEKVFDSRNRRVRGLWKRNGLFYAQLRRGGLVTKVRLHECETVPQAVTAMQALKREPEPARPAGSITLRVATREYEEEQIILRVKRPGSLARERSGMKAWLSFLGDPPVGDITESHGVEFARHRRASGVSGRAVDLDIVAIRNVLKRCRRLGQIETVPFEHWQRMAGKPKRIRLLTAEEINLLCRTAEASVRNNHGKAPCKEGRLFSDYLRLLSLTGAREREALHLRWSAVDWSREQIEIGRGAIEVEGDPNVAKNRTCRIVPFSSGLRSHLKAMLARVDPTNPCDGLLFPSPRGGGVITSLKKSLALVLDTAGVHDFGWHHLRHYFISHCVMSGIDYKTIAEWVGHRDGGVLIGRVYSHLNDEHSRRQAARLRFL